MLKKRMSSRHIELKAVALRAAGSSFKGTIFRPLRQLTASH